MGAVLIEKHFSFNRTYWGPDHKASILPVELKELVDKIRSFEIDRENNMQIDINGKYNGFENKILQDFESQFRPIFRKSLVASENIPKKTIIIPSMIYAMRPQKYIKGLSSEYYESIIGKRTVKDIKKYESIDINSLEQGL
jgi:sialic acid synthase SpsE